MSDEEYLYSDPEEMLDEPTSGEELSASSSTDSEKEDGESETMEVGSVSVIDATEAPSSASKKPKKLSRADIENMYHRSKDLADDEGPPFRTALEGFNSVMVLEMQKFGKHAEWSYRALKRIVQLTAKLGDAGALMQRFRELLSFKVRDAGISEADVFKGITKILNTVSSGSVKLTMTSSELVVEMHELAASSMLAAKNENLWFKTKLKLAHMLFNDMHDLESVHKTITELKAWCMMPDGQSENPKRSNQLLDVYALEVLFHLERKDQKSLKDIFGRGLALASRNTGTLRSKLGIFYFVDGKSKMEQREWKEAYTSLFEAFTVMEDAKFKIPCLRYIIVSCMLARCDFNLFSSVDIKHMEKHKQVKPFSDLFYAFQANRVDVFEKVIQDNKEMFESDPFVAQFIQPLLHQLRSQTLVLLVRPYTQVTLGYLSKQLRISSSEVEELLVALILNKRIDGQIDQVKQLVLLRKPAVRPMEYTLIDRWCSSLNNLHGVTLGKVN